MVKHGTVSHVNVGEPQKSDMVIVHSRVNQRVYRELKRIAKEDGRSVSAVIARSLMELTGKAVRDGK